MFDNINLSARGEFEDDLKTLIEPEADEGEVVLKPGAFELYFDLCFDLSIQFHE